MNPDLSTEANVIYGGLYQMIPKNEVTFQRPHIMTEQARKGFDDLVEAGYLTVEPFNKYGALTWRPTAKLHKERFEVSRDYIKQHNFKLTSE